MDIADSALLFGMLNLSGADAAINCWNDKYYWDFWRPWQAIHEADRDGNPATEPDPSWTALLTAPYPEHPSGHLCLDGAHLGVLQMFFGTDKIRFDVTSGRFPGETATSTGSRSLSRRSSTPASGPACITAPPTCRHRKLGPEGRPLHGEALLPAARLTLSCFRPIATILLLGGGDRPCACRSIAFWKETRAHQPVFSASSAGGVMRLPTRTLLVMSIAALVLATVVAPASARPARVDAVTVWNANAGQAALDACLAPTNNPLHESRLYAAMHVAIHDALNAIDRRSVPTSSRLERNREPLPMLPWLRRRETCWSTPPAAPAPFSDCDRQRRGRGSIAPMRRRWGRSRTVRPSGRVLPWDRPLLRPSLP